MPFDGGFMRKICQEISGMAGAHVDKISQPTREILILWLHGAQGTRKLLLSASAVTPKIHFTDAPLENPKTAPMFCMLLRKRLGGGKLLRAEQAGLDRVLTLAFECTNELGDRVELRLICEIMGRHSNIILTDGFGKILESIKRVDFAASETRPILPGIVYTLPPAQPKIDITADGEAALIEMLLSGRAIPLSKALQEKADGFSPMLCREVSHFVCAGADLPAADLSPAQLERLRFYLGVVAAALRADGGRPCIVLDADGRPADFSYLEPLQFPTDWKIIPCASCSEAVDRFFAGRDAADEMRRRSAQLLKTVSNMQQRLVRKLAAQGQELERTALRQQYREWGDLISANLYQLRQGDTLLRTPNLFSEAQETLEIPLDARLSPSKNAQRYYTEYRKASTAEQKLRELIASGKHELEYLDSVLSQLRRVPTGDDLEGIRQELAAQGLIHGDRGKKARPVRLAPLRFRSSDGFVILCGRNNLQNDQLTLREAKNYDLWLHTQKIHGSHVILISEPDREFSPTAIEEAAVIAAVHSDAAEQVKVPVDYTPVKYVKKPNGARPGMVVYETYQTLMVVADKTRAQTLREK